MKNLTTIIFDMDGVVIDSRICWDNANKVFFKRFGIDYEPNYEVLSKLNGKSPIDAMAIWQEHYGIVGDTSRLTLERSEEVIAQFNKLLKYMPSFNLFHKELTKAKFKFAIATGADYLLLKEIKKLLQLERYFGRHIYSVEDVGFKSKPDPATFLLAAEKLGNKPEECAVIEDSPLGIEAAKRAGMYAIGFVNGEEEVKFEQADLIVKDFSDPKLAQLLTPDS